MRTLKLDNLKNIVWLCPDIYVSFVFTDKTIPEVWVHRDSCHIAACAELMHTQMLNVATTYELDEEILDAIVDAINNHLLFDDEEVVIDEDEFYITATK